MKYIKIEGEIFNIDLEFYKKLRKYQNKQKYTLIIESSKIFENINLKFFKRYFNITNKKNKIDLVIPYKYFYAEIESFKQMPAYYRFLYLDSKELMMKIISTLFSKERLAHVISTSDTCVKIGKNYNLNTKQLWQTGLFHDLTKELDDIKQDEYLRYYEKEKLDYHYKVKHSFSCKYFLKEKFNYYDTKVINAIDNHTILRSNDILSKVLYVADKKEPLRKAHDGILEMSYHNLDNAAMKVKLESKVHVAKL